ncbi:MAG: NYN domain-containing protein [Rikenellaceae bacterium]|nr:NYN domain-containing protein [Rikenellaceae bacterium]
MNIYGNSSSVKIGVFYDGNFFLHASNYYNYVHAQRKRLSITGLHNFIKNRVSFEHGIEPKKCHIVEAHYFRGRINAAEASQRGSQLYNDRVFDDILMSEGIHAHYLPLRNLLGRKEERGIDVWLSLEVYELTLKGRLDMIVLIVSDTDYVPLVRKLNTLGLDIMLLSWEFEYYNDEGVRMVTKTSHDLLQLATHPVYMQDVIDKGLEEGDPVIMDLFVSNDVRSGSDDERTKERGEILSIKNGFGFIKFPNNNLFFHYQDVLGDFNELVPGQMVEFTVEKNAMKQDVAKNVKKIDSDIESDFDRLSNTF